MTVRPYAALGTDAGAPRLPVRVFRTRPLVPAAASEAPLLRPEPELGDRNRRPWRGNLQPTSLAAEPIGAAFNSPKAFRNVASP
jgi:hypothetical protein